MGQSSASTLRGASRSQIHTHERPRDSFAFDRLVVALSAWFTGGVYLDGWAHQHVPSLETFFTPWHAVFYSGYLAIAVVIGATAARYWLKGHALGTLLPAGYELSLAGVVVFALGGVGDLIWHSLFGIEASVDALLSPTHLILAMGMTLILTGPVCAADQRTKGKEGWAELWPALLALTLTLSLFAFFTQYATPFGETIAAASTRLRLGNAQSMGEALGVVSILWQTALLMGFVLYAVRRWQLPFGSLALVLGLSTLMMTLMRDDASGRGPLATGALPLIAVAAIAGLAGDVLVWLWQPSPDRPAAFHAAAFVIPAALYALYFGAIQVWGGGIWWTIHMWAGAIFLAGIVGLLVSYAMLPLAIRD